MTPRHTARCAGTSLSLRALLEVRMSCRPRGPWWADRKWHWRPPVLCKRPLPVRALSCCWRVARRCEVTRRFLTIAMCVQGGVLPRAPAHLHGVMLWRPCVLIGRLPAAASRSSVLRDAASAPRTHERARGAENSKAGTHDFISTMPLQSSPDTPRLRPRLHKAPITCEMFAEASGQGSMRKCYVGEGFIEGKAVANVGRARWREIPNAESSRTTTRYPNGSLYSGGDVAGPKQGNGEEVLPSGDRHVGRVAAWARDLQVERRSSAPTTVACRTLGVWMERVCTSGATGRSWSGATGRSWREHSRKMRRSKGNCLRRQEIRRTPARRPRRAEEAP